MTKTLSLGLLCFAVACSSFAYEPAPENLAARKWFQDVKFGVFIHWGVYSELGRGEWVMNNEKMSIADYEPLAERFNPTEFDPDAWCRLFKEAGAGYVTITSKHHDGFCLWDTDQTDWDIVDRTPYGRDLLKQLADACRRHDLKLFFYHSQLDWYQSDYFPRGRTGKASGRPESGDFDRYIDYMNAQLTELLDGDYGEVTGIWFDGWWDQQTKKITKAKDVPVKQCEVDWRLRETYDLIHRLQPACLVGSNHHVAPFPGEDFQMFEKDLPGQNKSGFSADAKISTLPLEACNTINKSWGYREKDTNHKTPKQLVGFLVRSAGANANLLLNIGPKPDGTIDTISTARLKAVGEWLGSHGESIYGTRGGPVAPQEWGVTTQNAELVYVHVLDPPAAAEGWTTLSGAADLQGKPLHAFGSGDAIDSRLGESGELQVRLPARAEGEIDTILVTSR